MKFTTAQYALSLHQVIAETHPKDQDLVIDNFIKLLKNNGDLAAYTKIISEFEKLTQEDESISKVEITTATPQATNKAILKELNDYVKKDAKVTYKTDESIIGGVIVKVDDTLIDASLRHQLGKLGNSLNSNL